MNYYYMSSTNILKNGNFKHSGHVILAKSESEVDKIILENDIKGLNAVKRHKYELNKMDMKKDHWKRLVANREKGHGGIIWTL